VFFFYAMKLFQEYYLIAGRSILLLLLAFGQFGHAGCWVLDAKLAKPGNKTSPASPLRQCA
jgi:hypothetical protein